MSTKGILRLVYNIQVKLAFTDPNFIWFRLVDQYDTIS